MESEQAKRTTRPHEGDDWLDGVRTGQQAEKRLLIERLHWILDPTSEAVDLQHAGPLVARLNERLTEGDDGYKDGYKDGGSPKPGPEYPGGPTGGPPYPGFGPPRS